jgi:hypothetical protein
MADYINYIAVNGEYVTFGLSEDPAADVVEMQAGSPSAINLVAGWVVPPPERLWLKERIERAFRRAKHRGVWVQAPEARAVELMGRLAAQVGGVPWKLRKRPLPSIKPPSKRAKAVLTPNGRFASAKAAGEAYGLSRQAAWERANRQTEGWQFEDQERPFVRPARGRPRKLEQSP